MIIAIPITEIIISNLKANNLKEKDFQKVFCNQMKGEVEVAIKEKGKNTRIDCVFNNYACEVDWGHKVYESIGQNLL